MEHVHTVNMHIALLVLLIIAGIVNILGIYLLYKLKSKLRSIGYFYASLVVQQVP